MQSWILSWNLWSVFQFILEIIYQILHQNKNLIAWTPHIPEAQSSSTSIVFCCLTWRRQKHEQNPLSNCHNLALSCLCLLLHHHVKTLAECRVSADNDHCCQGLSLVFLTLDAPGPFLCPRQCLEAFPVILSCSPITSDYWHATVWRGAPGHN